MATAYKALVSAVLLLYVLAALSSARFAALDLPLSTVLVDGEGGHQRLGLLVALFAVLVQAIAFAYFLGTGFWVKYFAESAGAGLDWERRHREWMKARGYAVLYLAAASALALAILGGLADTGRVDAGWHGAVALVSALMFARCLVRVPEMMTRNSRLMDELAARHQVPRPDTAEAQALHAQREAESVPPLFQLSRVLMFFAFNVLALWLYLRFGTEGFRDTPVLPFALVASVLLTLGLAWNAAYDPDTPRPPRQAWTRALLVGGGCVLLSFVLS